jgi:uncharacterized protein (DUF58 family)
VIVVVVVVVVAVLVSPQFMAASFNRLLLIMSLFLVSANAFRSAPLTKVAATVTSAQRMFSAMRTFAGYSVYKRRALLNVNVIPPTFRKVKGGRSVEREGCVLLTVAPGGSGETLSLFVCLVVFRL